MFALAGSSADQAGRRVVGVRSSSLTVREYDLAAEAAKLIDSPGYLPAGSRVISLLDAQFGILANGTDETAKINTALAFAKANGYDVVYVPPLADGQFIGYTGNATGISAPGVTVDSVKLIGYSARKCVFKNLNAKGSAGGWKFTGSAPWICNITINCNSQRVSRSNPVRTAYDYDSAIVIEGALGGLIAGVTGVHTRCAGIFNNGGINCLFYGNQMVRSASDAFHSTKKAQGCTFFRNAAVFPGDDGFSVVSYEPQGGRCTDMKYIGNDVVGQSNGRGLTVIGGSNVLFEDNTVAGAFAAAAAVGSESSYQTYGCDNIIFRRNRFDGCGTTTARSTQTIAGVFINAGRGDVDPYRIRGVVFEDNHMSHFRWRAIAIFGAGVYDVTIRNNTLVGRVHKEWTYGDVAIHVADAQDVYIEDNDLSEIGLSAMFFGPTIKGKLHIKRNTVRGWNYLGQSGGLDGIILGSPASAAYTELKVESNKAFVYWKSSLAANAAITATNPDCDSMNRSRGNNARQYPGANWPMDGSTTAKTIKPYAFQWAANTQGGNLPVSVVKTVTGNELLLQEVDDSDVDVGTPVVQNSGSFATHGGFVINGGT